MRVRAAIGLAMCAAAAMFAAGAPADAAWKQSTFQVGGYLFYGPPLDAGRINRLNDAGLDWFTHWSLHPTFRGEARIAAITDSLRVARPGFALKNILTYAAGDSAVGDNGAGRLTVNIDQPLAYGVIGRAIRPAAGINNASTLGWSIWDEPCDTLAFGSIGRLSRFLTSDVNGSARLAYVNLYPSYLYDVSSGNPAHCYHRRFGAGSGLSKEAGYAAYLRAYLSLFDTQPDPAPVLSFDSFPFQVPDAPQRDYFMNLRLARDATAEYGRNGTRIPFWVVVQLSPFRFPGRSRFPANFSFVNTRWQVFCALAYGAKGVSYWGTASYANPNEVWGPGFLADDGDTVAVVYSQVRQLDGELHHLGPTLMRLDPVACFHGSTLGWSGIDNEVFPGTQSTDRFLRSLGPASEALLVGHLRDRDRGDDYLLVVNKALTEARTYTLTLASTAASVERIDRATGAAVLVDRNTNVVTASDLAPGQGELFRIGR